MTFKTYFLLLVLLVGVVQSSRSQGQVKVVTGGTLINDNTNVTSPDESSVLEVESLSKGVLFPRLSTAQRDHITAPAEGLLVYNLDYRVYQYFNGDEWIDMGTRSLRPNRAIQFDGIDSKAVFSDLNLAVPDQWSLELWFKSPDVLPAVGEIQTIFTTEQAGAPLMQISLIRIAAGVKCELQIYDEALGNVVVQSFQLSGFILPNEVYMLGVTATISGNDHLYSTYFGRSDRGAVVVESTENTIGQSQKKLGTWNKINLGHRPADNRFFAGAIDNCRMYLDALTLSDWEAQYNLGDGNGPFSSNVIWQFEMDRIIGGKIEDKSPGGRDLELLDFDDLEAALIDF